MGVYFMKNQKKQPLDKVRSVVYKKLSEGEKLTDNEMRLWKLEMVMAQNDCSEIVAECILDAMEEQKAEYKRVSSMIQDCYPGNNTVH